MKAIDAHVGEKDGNISTDSYESHKDVVEYFDEEVDWAVVLGSNEDNNAYDAYDPVHDDSDGKDSWESEELKTPPNSDDEWNEESPNDNFSIFSQGGRFGELMLQVGMKFISKQEFINAVREYTIQEGREIKFTRNEGHRVRAICKWKDDEQQIKCPWVAYASRDHEETCWQLKTFKDEHICPRLTKNRAANRRWLAQILVKKLRKYPNMKHNEAMAYFKRRCGLSLNKSSGIYKILLLSDCTSLMEFSLLLSTDSDTTTTQLETLSLDGCSNLSLLPHNIGMLSSLKYLSLCRSSITSLPKSIKHLSLLKFLNLRGCEKLQSLPELPSSISELDVINCTSLEKIIGFSYSSFKQEQIERENFAFANCIKLDQVTKKVIMEDASMRIKRQALTCLAAIKENEDEDRRASLVNPHYHYKVQGCLRENEMENEEGREYQYLHRVQFCFPGKQVPGWFSYRSRKTETMTIELVLPHHASRDRFLGFMLCVVPKKSSYSGFLGCKYCIEGGRDCKSVEYSSSWNPSPKKGVCDNVFLWYVGDCCLDIVREMKENVYNKKVSFQFSIDNGRGGKLGRDDIKQCGVHPIYASDMLKQWVVMTDMDDENENECDPEEEEELSFLHINKKLKV